MILQHLQLEHKVAFILNQTGNKFTYSESKKSPPPRDFLTLSQTVGIFSPNFTGLLHVPIYARLQIFIQLSPTVTKLCYIKCGHHHILKMSTIGRNARWVVALNMA